MEKKRCNKHATTFTNALDTWVSLVNNFGGMLFQCMVLLHFRLFNILMTSLVVTLLKPNWVTRQAGIYIYYTWVLFGVLNNTSKRSLISYASQKNWVTWPIYIVPVQHTTHMNIFILLQCIDALPWLCVILVVYSFPKSLVFVYLFHSYPSGIFVITLSMW